MDKERITYMWSLEQEDGVFTTNSVEPPISLGKKIRTWSSDCFVEKSTIEDMQGAIEQAERFAYFGLMEYLKGEGIELPVWLEYIIDRNYLNYVIRITAYESVVSSPSQSD